MHATYYFIIIYPTFLAFAKCVRKVHLAIDMHVIEINTVENFHIQCDTFPLTQNHRPFVQNESLCSVCKPPLFYFDH